MNDHENCESAPFCADAREDLENALAEIARLTAERDRVQKPITMNDIRLCAGEGKLSAHAVLDAANAVLRQRARLAGQDTVREG